MTEKKKENIIEHEIHDEMKESYIDYAMSVIVGRALPDARDGLKPVHRRILYGMSELGVTPDKPYKKSARIVGEVMGKYHPHGDCLDADTRVFLLDGTFRTIKELYEEGKPQWVLAIDEKTNRILPAKAHSFRIGQRTDRIYHIKLSNGFVIKATGNHPFRLTDGRWIKTENLKENQIIDFAMLSLNRGNYIICTPHKEMPGMEIHTLVAEHNMIEGEIIYHIDGNKANNSPENLTGLTYDEYAELNRKNGKSEKTSEDSEGVFPVGETEIRKITVETLNKKIPMYDFTVDGHHNMLISAREDNRLFAVAHNSSIYEAMVRMAQDFSMRYMFVDGHGNFGSVDGDGAAAMRYCVTGDTLIKTNLGLVPIESLKEYVTGEEDLEGISVYDYRGKKTSATKFFDCGKHPVRKITLKNGMSITVTSNHPLMVLDRMNNLSWKKAGDIDYKDVIVLLKFAQECDKKATESETEEAKKMAEFITRSKVEIKHDMFMDWDIPKQRELLKFLFTNSGKVDTKKIRVVFRTDKLEVLSLLQTALISNFGVVSEIKRNELIISDECLENFEEYVGFADRVNQEKLTEMRLDNNYWTYDRYAYGEVASNREYGMENVYSVRVDNPESDHSFIANGFINHNTEARMSPFSIEMLKDIRKDTVDFMPNFDEEEKEPTVLPSRIPNLLVNGSNGIAVGMATSIPPHNLGEVIDACTMLIDSPESTIGELTKKVKGPDFPTGGIIMGREGFKAAYKTGNGKVTVRAKTEIEEAKNGKYRIIVTELPYQVNKARLIEKIATLIKDKKLDGISTVRDESNREGMRMVIELKRDANPHITLNRLFKQTQLQENVSMIMLALVNGEPKTLNLKEILEEYLKHQKEVTTRRTEFDLSKDEARLHIVEGLKKALDSIDEIIKVIRASRNDAKEKLMKQFGFSDIQAQAILDMKLARLQKLEREKLEQEYDELKKRIAYYNELLADEKKLMSVVKDELLEVRAKWADKRRTKIERDATETDETDLIDDEQIVVTLTNLGYIKRVPLDTYQTQKRGGKGKKALTTRDNDVTKEILATSSLQTVAFFTNLGKVYMMKAYNIPEAGRTAKGMPIVNFLNLMQKERIAAMLPIDESSTEHLIMATKNGYIKKTAMSEFANIRSNGLYALKLEDGDELIGVSPACKGDRVIIFTAYGKCISFPESDVRAMGRNARGVASMKFDDDDYAVSMQLANDNQQVMVMTEKGFGKRTDVKDYRMQKRGGKGVLSYNRKKIDETGVVMGSMLVTNKEEILLITSDGLIERVKVTEIPKSSRVTRGSRIIDTRSGGKVISLCKVE